MGTLSIQNLQRKKLNQSKQGWALWLPDYKDLFLDLCLRHLSMLCTACNIDLRVQHIRGSDNVIADVLSRGKYNQLEKVTWEVIPYELYSLDLLAAMKPML